jgi:hypothetical protein
MRNTTEDVGQFRNRKKKGKAGLKKTQGFEEDSEDERKGSGGSGRGSMAKDDTAIRRDGSSESGMGNSNGGGSSGGVSLLDSDEKGSSRSHRRRRKQTSAEDEEDREIKYVLTHPPWYASALRSTTLRARAWQRADVNTQQGLSAAGDRPGVFAALRFRDVGAHAQEGSGARLTYIPTTFPSPLVCFSVHTCPNPLLLAVRAQIRTRSSTAPRQQNGESSKNRSCSGTRTSSTPHACYSVRAV